MKRQNRPCPPHVHLGCSGIFGIKPGFYFLCQLTVAAAGRTTVIVVADGKIAHNGLVQRSISWDSRTEYHFLAESPNRHVADGLRGIIAAVVHSQQYAHDREVRLGIGT